MKRLLTVAAALAVAVGLASPAHAARPTVDRVQVDEMFVDGELSEACGFTVTAAVQGHLIFRTFEDADQSVVSLLTLNVALTFSADGNEYQARDVGADLVRITPDGTAILMVIGQLPFDFTGVLKVNLDTGDVILEPQHSTADELAEACAVLAG
jgi:hypothetical protein